MTLRRTERLALWLLAGATVVFASACGGDSRSGPKGSGDSTTDDGSTTHGTGVGATSSTEGGSSSTTSQADSSTTQNANVTNTSSGGSGGSPSSDSVGGSAGAATEASGGSGSGGAGGQGGCWSLADCAEDEWCDFPDDLCGDGAQGACKRKPMGGSDGLYTCGCDGQIYMGPVLALLQGVDADALARCGEPDPGAFWCGAYRCFERSYCDITETPCATHYDCGYAGSCEGTCDCIDSAGGQCSDSDGVATVRRTLDACRE